MHIYHSTSLEYSRNLHLYKFITNFSTSILQIVHIAKKVWPVLPFNMGWAQQFKGEQNLYIPLNNLVD